MPSGAKKRKAAKKKQANTNVNPSSAPITHSHGDDDLKHLDEKESDGGEVSSPASQDPHTNQHPFTEGEEEEVEKREDTSSVQSFATENKSVEGNNYDGESVQEAAKQEEAVVIIEEDCESKNVIIESAKESQDGSSSGSSSSSSSDDESNAIEKKAVVMETSPRADLIKPDEFLAEVVTQVNSSISVQEAYDSVVETPSVVELDKAPVLEQVLPVDEIASVDKPVTSGEVDFVFKENGQEKLPSLDENSGVLPVIVDSESQKKEDDVVLKSDANASSLDATDSGAQVDEKKVLLSVSDPADYTRNGAEQAKDSLAPECSDTQPLVASAPRTAQTTSWKGCCGILELFTGSNR